MNTAIYPGINDTILYDSLFEYVERLHCIYGCHGDLLHKLVYGMLVWTCRWVTIQTLEKWLL